MGGNSAIEWTDVTWNPTTGCTRISPGCWNCYAFQLHDQRYLAWKRGAWPDAPVQYHQPFSRVQLLRDRLAQPLHWRTPRRVFVDSMSDLFHDDVPDDYLDRVFAVMALCPQHTFQILTKRPERMRQYMTRDDGRQHPKASPYCARDYITTAAGWLGHDLGYSAERMIGVLDTWPLPNVHLGISVENQDAADTRVGELLQTPAAVRFLSCEPLLSRLTIESYLWLVAPSTAGPWRDWTGAVRERGRGIGGQTMSRKPPGDLAWVIIGGESGPHARPMDLAWARWLMDECRSAALAVFVKQLGTVWAKENGAKDPHGGNPDEWPADLRVREMPEVRYAR